VWVCVRVYIHTYIYVCVHKCVYECVRVSVRLLVCAHIYTYMCVCVRAVEVFLLVPCCLRLFSSEKENTYLKTYMSGLGCLCWFMNLLKCFEKTLSHSIHYISMKDVTWMTSITKYRFLPLVSIEGNFVHRHEINKLVMPFLVNKLIDYLR
jgi:hypothetical protein